MSDYERTTIDALLDAGATADWITPTYGAVRDLLVDGKTFTVDGDTWHGLKPFLEDEDIAVWAVTMSYQGGGYWFTFSVNADDAPAVERFTGYRRAGGRGKALFMLLVFAVLLAGAALLVAAAMGGAF